ncbi:MAG TPA: homocysteine S-methyltransferase family protein [Candidatus Avacidaminococcus intestinavium]|uniref:Methionine synthase n=1 Tax=Candidatus Avacidaminococcus intestinavium TaxID=2840684 RepID=A0A9D1MPT0_9FIRM|nr:homocysteine S-methyltransferase family protein [Candidatus Avacidaminococcus intestinavium]
MIKIFEGAMGTRLQALGIAEQPCPEYASVTHPEEVTAIHKMYAAAGADILETNTFGASPLKLAYFDLADETEKIITAGVNAARRALLPGMQLAGNLGPSGRLIAPLGNLGFEEACEAYARQVRALAAAGVDYILFETIIDLQEMRAGVLAAKSVANLPIICQLTYDAQGRTVTGTDPTTAAAVLEPLGAAIIGMNCSLGPEQLYPLVQELAAATSLPISVQPNAGLPILKNGETIFPLSPAEMAAWVPKLVAAGASIIGGCCGTTAEHIRAIKEASQTLKPKVRAVANHGVRLASRTQTVCISSAAPTVLIGERINPSGRKALAATIKSGDLTMVKREALTQVQAGAEVLDINMGVPGVDQEPLMQNVVSTLSMLVDVPFSIDSTEPAVIEAGLRSFPGRALINSVSDKPGVKEQIFALAKQYGAAVLLLPLEERGLPQTAEERLVIAKRLAAEGKEYGLQDTDFMLDPLVLTAASDGKAPRETLRTLRLYREELGYPTTMGLSNVSFGLPGRADINLAFFLMAIEAGLDAPIINPSAEGVAAMRSAAQVIRGTDSQGLQFSQNYVQRATGTAEVVTNAVTQENVLEQLCQAVMLGEKERAATLAIEALAAGHAPAVITSQALVKGMHLIGEDFGAGRTFLPQVMLAAETMKAAFDAVRSSINAEDIPYAGKVLLATVKGDIHDLGKNIVSALLKNSGFAVVDLGKDVDPQTILTAVREERPEIIGLCALMTTTLGSMEETIRLLKEAGEDVKIMVGGAVLTADYAEEIKADVYAKDGVQAVRLAENLLAKS